MLLPLKDIAMSSGEPARPPPESIRAISNTGVVRHVLFCFRSGETEQLLEQVLKPLLLVLMAP